MGFIKDSHNEVISLITNKLDEIGCPKRIIFDIKDTFGETTNYNIEVKDLVEHLLVGNADKVTSPQLYFQRNMNSYLTFIDNVIQSVINFDFDEDYLITIYYKENGNLCSDTIVGKYVSRVRVHNRGELEFFTNHILGV